MVLNTVVLYRPWVRGSHDTASTTLEGLAASHSPVVRPSPREKRVCRSGHRLVGYSHERFADSRTPTDMASDLDFSLEPQILRRLRECRNACTFEGHRPEQLWRWQVDHRMQLRRAMRLNLPTVYTTPRFETVESLSRDDVRVELLAIQIEEDHWLPTYIVRAGSVQDGRTLIVLHGLGYGAAEPADEALRSLGRQDAVDRRKTYAVDWARSGYIVAIPELRGYGRLMLQDDRRAVESGQVDREKRNSLRRLMAIYLRLGQTYAGCCVGDLIRLLDHLEAREEVDPDRIGISGVGTGAHALSWLVALEDRIAAAVVVASWRSEVDSVLDPELEPPPVFESFGLVDPITILSCHVPKPLYIQAAHGEPPGAGPEPPTSLERLTRLYRLCGTEDRLIVNPEASPVLFDRTRVSQFLDRWL